MRLQPVDRRLDVAALPGRRQRIPPDVEHAAAGQGQHIACLDHIAGDLKERPGGVAEGLPTGRRAGILREGAQAARLPQQHRRAIRPRKVDLLLAQHQAGQVGVERLLRMAGVVLDQVVVEGGQDALQPDRHPALALEVARGRPAGHLLIKHGTDRPAAER